MCFHVNISHSSVRVAMVVDASLGNFISLLLSPRTMRQYQFDIERCVLFCLFTIILWTNSLISEFALD